jgi:hypothetical protein
VAKDNEFVFFKKKDDICKKAVVLLGEKTVCALLFMVMTAPTTAPRSRM